MQLPQWKFPSRVMPQLDQIQQSTLSEKPGVLLWVPLPSCNSAPCSSSPPKMVEISNAQYFALSVLIKTSFVLKVL